MPRPKLWKNRKFGKPRYKNKNNNIRMLWDNMVLSRRNRRQVCEQRLEKLIWANMCDYSGNSDQNFGYVHYSSMPQMRQVPSGFRRMRWPAMRPSWWRTVFRGVCKWMWNSHMRLVSVFVWKWGFMPRSRDSLHDESEQVSYVLGVILYYHLQSSLQGLCILKTTRAHGMVWCKSWHVLVSNHTFKNTCQKNCRWSHNLILMNLDAFIQTLCLLALGSCQDPRNQPGDTPPKLWNRSERWVPAQRSASPPWFTMVREQCVKAHRNEDCKSNAGPPNSWVHLQQFTGCNWYPARYYPKTPYPEL